MTTMPDLNKVHVDGFDIAYLEQGSGEPILLLHGYPENHQTWRNQIDALSAAHRVIAPDWFGWGESRTSASHSYMYDVEVARIGKLMDALGIDAANIFAHDYGGFLGLGFVQRHPERVLRFAILNTRAHRTFPLFRSALFASFYFPAQYPILRPLVARLPLYFLHAQFLRPHRLRGCFDGEVLGQYLNFMKTTAGRNWLAQFFGDYRLLPRKDLDEGLEAIKISTSIVWGTEDLWNPKSIARDLARRIPNASLVELEAGHFVMEEKPREVAAALLKLLERPASTS